mgnify:CR=1 FL=1
MTTCLEAYCAKPAVAAVCSDSLVTRMFGSPPHSAKPASASPSAVKTGSKPATAQSKATGGPAQRQPATPGAKAAANGGGTGPASELALLRAQLLTMKQRVDLQEAKLAQLNAGK